MTLVLVLLACSGSRPAAESPPAEVPVEAPVTETPAETPAETIATTPTQAYAECRERLEGVDTPGECASDADCAPAGCSHEMCIPVAKAGDVMSTCEVLPCFGAVQACGCHDGMCTWTLAAEMPKLGRVPLPPK